MNRIDGYLQSRIAFYLMNLHLTPRSIYFTRHGESQYNVEGKIGGDAPLSAQGEKYMQALPQLIQEKIGDTPLTVSCAFRTRERRRLTPLPPTRTGLDVDSAEDDPNGFGSTVREAHLEVAGRARCWCVRWHDLRGDRGELPSAYALQILSLTVLSQVSYPEDYAARDDDKFNYRYRGGESYRDVVIR